LIDSSPGHVLLAFAEPTVREAILRLIPVPWSMRKQALDRKLARVRLNGFELLPSSLAGGVTDISYPIHAREGKVVAALTVPFLKTGSTRQTPTIEKTREILERAARHISQSLILIR